MWPIVWPEVQRRLHSNLYLFAELLLFWILLKTGRHLAFLDKLVRAAYTNEEEVIFKIQKRPTKHCAFFFLVRDARGISLPFTGARIFYQASNHQDPWKFTRVASSLTSVGFISHHLAYMCLTKAFRAPATSYWSGPSSIMASTWLKEPWGKRVKVYCWPRQLKVNCFWWSLGTGAKKRCLPDQYLNTRRKGCRCSSRETMSVTEAETEASLIKFMIMHLFSKIHLFVFYTEQTGKLGEDNRHHHVLQVLMVTLLSAISPRMRSLTILVGTGHSWSFCLTFPTIRASLYVLVNQYGVEIKENLGRGSSHSYP